MVFVGHHGARMAGKRQEQYPKRELGLFGQKPVAYGVWPA